jgi:hypothetical protein
MSNKSTQPNEKGFFEKVKETIEEFWDGTKDTTEDIIQDIKEVASVKKATASKTSQAKAAVYTAKKQAATAKKKVVASGK